MFGVPTRAAHGTEMLTNDIPHLVRHLLEKHGLTQQGWRFAWDGARRRAGLCHYATKTIRLSRHYVDLNVTERLDDVIDTILHEIAHALTGPGHQHDNVWKEVCVQVGAKPIRCYDASVVVMPKGRYLATCGGCGREFRRYRRPKAGSWRYCRACGHLTGRLTYRDTAADPADTVGHTSPPLAAKRMR